MRAPRGVPWWTRPRTDLTKGPIAMSAADASHAASVDPETLARLAGGLAHELKNPLSTIGLHLSLLEEDWREEPGTKAQHTRRTIATVRKEIQHLQGILEDFLRFARTNTLACESQSLNPLVEALVRFATPECARRGIELKPILDLNLPPVAIDGGRIRQVVLNLILNARQSLEQASPAGQGGCITLITRQQSGQVVLEVVDDGPGMDQKTLDHCFEVYFSTKKGGSGLGLAIVKRIVEAHGGTVALESAPGRGTRVSLAFPISAEPTHG